MEDPMGQQTKLFKRILQWSEMLPLWQRDALRRLLLQGKLEAGDLDDLVELAKAESGAVDQAKNAAHPASEDHLPDATAAGTTVELHELRAALHVNALKEGQSLQVAQKGVTLIYGANGAGKSGYARVLKRACRARDRLEPVLANQRLPSAQRGVPQATIVASVNGAAPEGYLWVEGKAPPTILSGISVFDAHCARHYIDRDNEVAYMPYGIDVVEALGTASRTVKDRLLAEAQRVTADTTQFGHLIGSTRVGKFVASLSAESDLKTLDQLCQLTPEDKKRLVELRSALNTPDPIEAARGLSAKAARITELAEQCAEVNPTLGDAELEKCKATRQTLVSAKAFADAAARGLTETSGMLIGTGGAAWSALYKAAQEFAAEAFGSNADGLLHNKDVCVLCQQRPSDNGARLRRFDEYVQAQAEQEYQRAAAAYAATQRSVNALTSPFRFSPANEVDVLEFGSELSNECKRYRDAANSRAIAMQAAGISHKWEEVPPLAESPQETLSSCAEELKKRALALQQSADKNARKQLVQESEELEAREILVPMAESIRGAIAALARKSRLRTAADAINTAAISNTVKALVNESVSEALELALNEQFKVLGIGHIQVTLESRAEVGKVFHKLKMNLPSSVPPSQILSEGEQRAIALASFFAEVSLSPARSGIIFDDPMSSLDHRHRDSFAKRLVSVAATRQVVVFTHDLYFMALVQAECANQQVSLHCQTVKSEAALAGHVSGDLPFEGMSTKDRVKYLRNLGQQAGKLLKDGREPIAKVLLKTGYGQLRESWERVVEEVLLGGVVGRFVPDIGTQKLRYVAVEDADFIEVDAAMTRCSSFAHDTPRAAGPLSPTLDEFSADVDALEAFRTRINKRNDDTSARRKAALAAPAA